MYTHTHTHTHTHVCTYTHTNTHTCTHTHTNTHTYKHRHTTTDEENQANVNDSHCQLQDFSASMTKSLSTARFQRIINCWVRSTSKHSLSILKPFCHCTDLHNKHYTHTVFENCGCPCLCLKSKLKTCLFSSAYQSVVLPVHHQ